jgi:C_GCAxxG_C_C family probable redox protein
VAAFSDLYGIDEEQAKRIGAGFGGGVGRLRMMCGAVSGIVILVGLDCGQTDGDDRDGKSACYQVVQQLLARSEAENGSLITRELRAACGFTGPNMRSKFDGYITRLQMAARIVTEDFVYPTDKHGREYGWGWSLLTTPEALYGRDACQCVRTPEESYQRIFDHLRQLLPEATERQIRKLI